MTAITEEEAIARIVAPHAWADHDRDVSATPWAHPYIQDSLSKARQIIALRSEREEGEPGAWCWDRVEVEHGREWVSTIYGRKRPAPSRYIRNVQPLYLRKAQGSDNG